MQRIVSLIPSGTEIVAALVEDRNQLFAVTHECDEPEWVRSTPKVVHPADPKLIDMSPEQVDKLVSESIGTGQSLYVLDESILNTAAPDLIVTQRLCDVCTVSTAQVQRAIFSLPKQPSILELSPMSLEDVIGDVGRVGDAIGRPDRARQWQSQLRERIAAVKNLDPLIPRPRVLALEWPDPLWTGGHWIPEMIEIAGGTPLLGTTGQPSVRVDWQYVQDAAPDFVILMSCGYGVERNLESVALLERLPDWNSLPAVQKGNVFAVDANSYFSRSGPRLVDGCELLASVFRGKSTPRYACRRVVK